MAGAGTGRRSSGRAAPRRGRPRRSGDRGSGTIWLLAVGALLLSAALLGVLIGSAMIARHQAQVAADLGALAGASSASQGPERACARAAEFVTANGGRLTGCELTGLDLILTVEVSPAGALGSRVATASARAGPVRDPA